MRIGFILSAMIALPLLGQVPTSANSAFKAEKGYVALTGGRLYYEVAGTGSTVVFLNGANLDARMWEPQFAALAASHRVIRYDERGFGRSSAADVPYSASDDLDMLLDSLHITKVSLVGLSLGGRIALDFALQHPSSVDRLVLASPGISGWRFSLGDTSWAPSWRAAKARNDSVGMARAWLGSGWMQPAMEQSRLRPILRTLIVASAGYWIGLVRHGDTERPADPPALGRTRAIRACTLIVVGSRDVPDILRIADTLIATIPRARRVMLKGVGHVVNLEDPDRFTRELSDFLRAAPSNERCN
jgi:pimeloyl-ACP methyl ester carboxylesterase